MNDLQILINETPAVISTNFEDVKNGLTDLMKNYEGLTYTDDTVNVARKDIATLRKIRKAIDDKIKEVKKAHMIPYDEFEAKAKELCEIIDNAINPINQQIKDYAERKRLERKASIMEYFNVSVGDIDCITFEDVFQPTWISNMSTSMKSIKAEIDKCIENVKNDLAAIEMTESEVKDKALATYKQTKRLSDAMKVINDYEQQKREILAREEARKKAEEERRRQEEERHKRDEEERIRREEARRIAEEERKRKEEADRIERERQAAIQKAVEEEREKIRKELAEKERVRQEEEAKKKPEEEAKTANNPFGQADPFASQVIPEQAPNPFDQKEPESASNPFQFSEPEHPENVFVQQESQEPEKPLTGEVEPVATSEQETVHSVLMRFKATGSQVNQIEKYLLSIDVSFIKQVM